VAALPGSGRDATNAFLEGSANVLISYENEAILARQSGDDFDYILPDATLKIENPGAVLKNANPKANAYLDFVLSQAGQAEFVKKGFRSVIADTPIGEVAGANDPANPFPVPAKLFTITDLGGWKAVNAKFFDEDGIVPEIQKATGRSQ
jgi:sulfate transport system substrate-binding protein